MNKIAIMSSKQTSKEKKLEEMSLLENAKQIQRNNKKWIKITDEDVELVFSFLRGEITIPTIQKAKGLPKGSSIYSYLVRAMREGVKMGKIYLEMEKSEISFKGE